MRVAIVSIAIVLSFLTPTATTQPQTHTNIKLDINNVYKKDTFPDRTAQAAEAKARDDEQIRQTQQALAKRELKAQEYILPPATEIAPPDGSKGFIYTKESGNNPAAVNASSGACGLGQAYPCSKLQAVCPNMDYACQDAFFTAYANERYGGWGGAYDFWVHNNWW